MNDYNILNTVADLVDRRLSVMEALQESRKFQIEARSRLVCRCPSCRSENEVNLAWLRSIRDSSQKPAPD
jgi:hypothetical protein